VKTAAVGFLCLAMVAPALAAKKKPKPPRDWLVGKVLDSTTGRHREVTGAHTTQTTTGTISPDHDAGADVNTRTDSSTEVEVSDYRTTKVIIDGEQFLYTVFDSVQAEPFPSIALAVTKLANRGHGCRFIMGDDIKYSQDKARLYVIDADGKECKTRIVKQERKGNNAQ
jgi:hypothetical protein